MIEATFEAGPLGLSLGQDLRLVSVLPGGAAEKFALTSGFSLQTVAGKSVAGLTYDEVVSMIRSSERPLVLTFLPPEKEPEPVTKSTSNSAINSTNAGAAVKKAGGFVKNILGAGVQVVKAVNKDLQSAFEDGAKQAKNVADAARRSKKFQQVVGGFDLRAVVARDGSIILTEDDKAFENCQNYVKEVENQIHTLREQNTENILLMEAVDTEVAKIHGEILREKSDLQLLALAISNHVPAISAEAEHLVAVTAGLKESFVAIESRMFALLLNRARSDEAQWASRAEMMANDYIAAKKNVLDSVSSDPVAAENLLNFELKKDHEGTSVAASVGEGKPEVSSPITQVAKLDATIRKSLASTSNSFTKLDNFVGSFGSSYFRSKGVANPSGSFIPKLSTHQSTPSSQASSSSVVIDKQSSKNEPAPSSPPRPVTIATDVEIGGGEIKPTVSVKDVAQKLERHESMAEEVARVHAAEAANLIQSGKVAGIKASFSEKSKKLESPKPTPLTRGNSSFSTNVSTSTLPSSEVTEPSPVKEVVDDEGNETKNEVDTEASMTADIDAFIVPDDVIESESTESTANAEAASDEEEAEVDVEKEVETTTKSQKKKNKGKRK